MANLTTRTELNATPADGDLVHIVDVSDTTDNAAGTSKKITRANLTGGLQAEPAEGAFVDGDKTKLDGIETGADVTDATNVNAAGAVMESDFNSAHSVLAQQAGTGSPGTVNLSDSQLLGKTSGGNIEGQSPAAVRATLNVEDGADVTDVTNVTTALNSIGISALSDVDTDKSKTPADGDVLTFDGTDWNAEAAAAGGGGNPYGATYVLAASGGDYTDLGTALAAMVSGDILYVEKGTYTETTAINITADDLTIIGQDRDDSILDFAGASTHLFDSDNLQIKNCTVQVSSTGDLYSAGSSGHYENVRFILGASSTTNGIRIYGGADTLITNCIIQDDGAREDRRFYFQSANGRFNNNRYTCSVGISDRATFGCIAFAGTGMVVDGNTFENTGTASAGDLFVSCNSSDMTFSNNRINANDYADASGLYISSNCIAIGNRIEGVRYGIEGASSYSIIANNHIEVGTGTTSGAQSGIREIYNGTVVSGNHITTASTYGFGIDVPATSNITITGNVVNGAATGVRLITGSSECSVIGNGFISCTNDITDGGTNNLTVTATDSDRLNTT